jgi:hypothetical protein
MEGNPRMSKLDLGVIGTSGLKQTGGVISEEWHPKLRGSFGPKVYREMSDNSSAIGAVLYLFETLTRQVEWRVEPSSPEQPAVDAAQFVEECLYDMSHTFEDFLSEVLSFFTYGWSYFELVYKLRKGGGPDAKPTLRSRYNDGKIGWRKIALRSQDTLDRWEFDSEDGGLCGMHQMDYSSGKRAYIPIEKALLFRTKNFKDNPEGRSLFRNAVLDWFFLKRICEIEAIGIERDMTGLLVMEVPTEVLSVNASGDARALRSALEHMLARVKRDEMEFAMVPSELDTEGKPTGFKLKLLSSGGRRQIDTPDVKNYYKLGILQSVLAQFIQLGMEGVGSYALASSQTNVFAMALGAYLDSIAATFNRFAISRLMLLNGVHEEYWPELVHGDIESPPLAEVGAYIQSLATAGQLPDDEAIQRKLLEIAKLPIPEREEGSEKAKDIKKKRGGLILKFAKAS